MGWVDIESYYKLIIKWVGYIITHVPIYYSSESKQIYIIQKKEENPSEIKLKLRHRKKMRGTTWKTWTGWV